MCALAHHLALAGGTERFSDLGLAKTSASGVTTKHTQPPNAKNLAVSPPRSFANNINNQRTTTPHLIVGAGLAGCLLAWQLHKAQQDFVLIGSRTLPSAFSVAAGVINPVAGRWMTKTWNADQLLPTAERTYREIEAALGIEVYHPIPEVRFCQNEEDVKRVGRRMRNPRYADVLGEFLNPGEASPAFSDTHGSFEIKGAAYVDLPRLVESLRTYFSQRHSFRDEIFRHEALSKASGSWQYGDIRAENIIFCEGAATKQNPWFSDLALNPVKGETLLCKSPTLQLDRKLYHHKKWLLPYEDGSFRIGATYDDSDLTPETTSAKAKELLNAAHSALNETHQIEVHTHLAGIRPSTVDSRPIIGPHPTEQRLYILNGLGSKGASVGPTMAETLTDHLLKNASIPEEISIARFSKSAQSPTSDL